MSGGLNRFLAAAVVAGAVLVVPPAALACGGGISAVNVYKECLPSGGGGKPTSGSGGGSSKSGGNTSSGPSSSPSVPISSRTKKTLKKAGSDRRALATIVRSSRTARFVDASGPAPVSAPTAIGSAFDLGSGPTTLLVLIAGTAVLLLAATGLRGLRQRRR